MSSEIELQRLRENWQRTVDDVADAATRAGRDAASVTIVGVSKYVDAIVAANLIEAGCHDLGESRPQQLVEKFDSIQTPSCPVRWHMIGNVQRNKSKRVVEIADVIHSVDSIRLLETMQRHASQQTHLPTCLIEVNISGEPDKHGFTPQQLRLEMPDILRCEGSIRVVGLMGMAGMDAKGDEARRQFASLRNLRDELAKTFAVPLPELSMGMSGDFVEAITEGATIVRIGSRLFEGVVG